MMLKRLLLISFLVILAVFAFDKVAYSQTLRFVQLSDTHINNTRADTTYKMLTDSYNLLSDAILQINEMKDIDFVMLTGDAVDLPNEDSLTDFIKMMNKLNVPWYSAIGNHDISILGGVTKPRYLKIMNSFNGNFNFEKTYYSIVPKKGFKVIVLDGVIENRITANGFISTEQLEWLDDELKSSKNMTVLIFMHYPLLEPFSSKNHRITNADEMYKILDKYSQPIAIFSGHYHSTKITKDNNVVHVSTPSLVTYPNAFRQINVTNYKDKVVFDFYFKETNLKEVQKKAKLKTLASTLYDGAESDRNTSVTVEKK